MQFLLYLALDSTSTVSKSAESSNSSSAPTKKYKLKRSKTDVGLKNREEYYTLVVLCVSSHMQCKFIAKGEPCPYGAACKYEHDIPTFLKNRGEGIGPVCPFWVLLGFSDSPQNAHGYCPMGLNCRWAMSHTSASFEPIEKPQAEQTPYVELNTFRSIPLQIRKKTYVFQFDSWKQNAKNTPEIDASGIDIRETPSSRSFAAIGPILPPDRAPLDFRGKIYIAPLTTVGNLPFRRICVELGADITCSEMAMCGNLLHSCASEWALLRRHPSERCFGVQITTGKVEDAGYVCELLRREGTVDFVDLNAGCPIDAVEKAGAGAGLLTKVGRLKRIVRCMLGSLENVPLMVKVRTGDHENTSHRLVPQLQRIRGNRGNRVSGVIIHGRTKQGRYTKSADWESNRGESEI